MDNGINIVIVADGPHKGMKMHGPRLLIKYKNTSVLDYLISGFNNIFTNYNLFVIANFKIKKSGVKTITRTILSEDCSKIISNNTDKPVLFIFEDTIPSYQTLKYIKGSVQSSLVFDSTKELSKHDVGGIIQNKNVQHLSYGLEIKTNHIQKWANILYLNTSGTILFESIVQAPKNKFMLNFEMVNHLLDKGHPIQAIHGKKIKTLNITTPNDISKIKEVI